MIVLGVDPGTSVTGLALVEQLRVHALGTARGTDGSDAGLDAMADALNCAIVRFLQLHGADLPAPTHAVVENQQVYTAGPARTKNPDSIIKIARVAGQAEGLIRYWLRCPIARPKPAQWKGQVEKGAHHRWLLDQFGIGYAITRGWVTPHLANSGVRLFGDEIRPGDWPDVLDAMGLAYWGVIKKVWR